jgi:hypothetical protein
MPHAVTVVGSQFDSAQVVSAAEYNCLYPPQLTLRLSLRLPSRRILFFHNDMLALLRFPKSLGKPDWKNGVVSA